MKNILSIPILFLGLIFTSCESFFDLESFNEVDDQQTIYDEGSAQTALRGVYSSFSKKNNSGSLHNVLLQSGGDAKSINSNQTDLNVINYDLRSDIGFLSTFWGNFYNTIDRANHIIQKVPNLPLQGNLTAQKRDQILGEAYFLRAYSYFDLARIFGNVQIFETPTVVVTDKLGVNQSSQKQVFEFVLSDLNKAVDLLGSTVIRNRANKFSALALRSKIKLYLNDYDGSIVDATTVLNETSSFKLIKPFNLRSGSTESIFELTFSANDNNHAFNNWQGANRQLEPKGEIYDLLKDPTIGGNRHVLVSIIDNKLRSNIYPNNTSPIFVLRTAELYLNRAEAYLKKSSPQINLALSDLNAVRERSDLTNFASAIKEDVLLQIEKERRVEFAFEPHRWFDLIRTGRARTVLGVSSEDKYIFPIPDGELKADPNLVQNPSYK